MNSMCRGVLLAGAIGLTGGVDAQEPPRAAEIVAVTGCLKESPAGTWMLSDATEPTVSTANAPSAKELASLPRRGKNQFQLTGVTVFDLPAHRNHTILVKGLLNKAAPVSRLNMTSLTMVASTCPPPAAK